MRSTGQVLGPWRFEDEGQACGGRSWSVLGAGVDESSLGPRGSLNSVLITPWWAQGRDSGSWGCIPWCRNGVLQRGHPLAIAPWSLPVV